MEVKLKLPAAKEHKALTNERKDERTEFFFFVDGISLIIDRNRLHGSVSKFSFHYTIFIF